MSSKIEYANYNFAGGYNSAAHPTLVKDNQCVAGSKNVMYRVSGEKDSISVVKRPGATWLDGGDDLGIVTHPVGPGVNVVHQTGYKKADNTEFIITLISSGGSGTLWSWDGTTKVNMGTGVLLNAVGADSELYQDKLYIQPHITGTLIEVTGGGIGSYNTYSLVDKDTNTFIGYIISEFEDRMYIAGDNGTGTALNRLFISVVGDATDYQGAGAGYVDFPSRITGLGQAENFLIVHTSDHGCFRLLFDASNLPYKQHIPNSKGTVDFRSIAEVDNVQVYLAKDGVYRLGYRENYPEEIGVSLLSENIKDVIDSIVPRYYSGSYTGVPAKYGRGFFFDNKYYLGYSTVVAGNHKNLIVYDFTARAWSAPWETFDTDRRIYGFVPMTYIFLFNDKLHTGSLTSTDYSGAEIQSTYRWEDEVYEDTGYQIGDFNEGGPIDMIYRTFSTYEKNPVNAKYWYEGILRYVRIDGGDPLIRGYDDDDTEVFEHDLSDPDEGSLAVPYLAGGAVATRPLGGIFTWSPERTDTSYQDIRFGAPLRGNYSYLEFQHNIANKSVELLGYSLGYRIKPRRVRANSKIY